jgi:uncharacterized UBP type Zn finger protein
MADTCEHFSAISQPLRATANGCAACIALRVCLTCGHVGCCEDSKHAHALQHYNETGHPMIASFERTDTWGWCYVHRRYFDPMPMRVPKRRSPAVALLARLLRR